MWRCLHLRPSLIKSHFDERGNKGPHEAVRIKVVQQNRRDRCLFELGNWLDTLQARQHRNLRSVVCLSCPRRAASWSTKAENEVQRVLMPEEKNMDIKLSGGNSRVWRKSFLKPANVHPGCFWHGNLAKFTVCFILSFTPKPQQFVCVSVCVCVN